MCGQVSVTFVTQPSHIETKPMHDISTVSRTIWLRTNRPVVPTNTANWRDLLAVQNALQQGLFAHADIKRPEFYEMEIDDNWYYVHVPSRIAGVYLIAAGRRLGATVLDAAAAGAFS